MDSEKQSSKSPSSGFGSTARKQLIKGPKQQTLRKVRPYSDEEDDGKERDHQKFMFFPDMDFEEEETNELLDVIKTMTAPNMINESLSRFCNSITGQIKESINLLVVKIFKTRIETNAIREKTSGRIAKSIKDHIEGSKKLMLQNNQQKPLLI